MRLWRSWGTKARRKDQIPKQKAVFDLGSEVEVKPYSGDTIPPSVVALAFLAKDIEVGR